ncbi:MAG: hypothetical protein IPJ89_03430 [Candidatus Iainarchaeum archaeon]|uniref:Uncharacterized protein n=1 Tax=Candidatus Iainarchaeum sp. TaxID=3101447 RepID=A0A7T9DJ10_9ARCH|nr:MAG: hypothetical protein IPJ89_03430 [Candidatus Diapherotrites archaeon]
MHPQRKDSLALAIAVIAILGVALVLSANRESFSGTTPTGFAAAGSAALCPIKQVVYGMGNAFSASQARLNAIQACRDAATAIPCPAQCPSSSATSEPLVIKEEHLPGSEWYHAWAECTRVCSHGIPTEITRNPWIFIK